MTLGTVVGFSGNITRPSKTLQFVNTIVDSAAAAFDVSASVFDIQDLGPSFSGSRRLSDLDGQARRIVSEILGADLLVVGSPTYKGSYTGLFKHFFDLLEPTALRGKPVILVATGGGERHSLVVEHQLRPLFGFFEAFSLPTAIYASEKDFSDGVPSSPMIAARISQVVAEAASVFPRPQPLQVAAE